MKAERQMSESSVRWFRRPTTSQVPITAAADDSLDAFRSESDKKVPIEEPPAEKPGTSNRKLVLIGIATFVGGVTAAGGTLFLRTNARPAVTSQTAQVTFETRPAGADVIIDGASRGNTPLIVQLSPGHHAVAIRKDGEERAVPLDLAAGTSVIQHFEFANQAAAPPAAATGKLTISTDPAGARVLIDDKLAGVSPLTVDLAPAMHKVVVSNERGTAERSMLVEAGVNAMMFSLPKALVPETGWLALSAPFEIQVIEHNEIIGTNAATKLMMATGAHTVDLVNESLGYRDQRRIQIDPGKTTALSLDAKSSLSLNARPWAEVTIDGRPAGQTPIANASVSLGSHQIVFRHPNLGERRQSVVVTARGPNRIGVDMTQ